LARLHALVERYLDFGFEPVSTRDQFTEI